MRNDNELSFNKAFLNKASPPVRELDPSPSFPTAAPSLVENIVDRLQLLLWLVENRVLSRRNFEDPEKIIDLASYEGAAMEALVLACARYSSCYTGRRTIDNKQVKGTDFGNFEVVSPTLQQIAGYSAETYLERHRAAGISLVTLFDLDQAEEIQQTSIPDQYLGERLYYLAMDIIVPGGELLYTFNMGALFERELNRLGGELIEIPAPLNQGDRYAFVARKQ